MVFQWPVEVATRQAGDGAEGAWAQPFPGCLRVAHIE